MEQGTEEWFNARCGCVTASKFKDIMAMSLSSGKPFKALEDYMWTVATERFYGTPVEGFTAKSTDWGKELEPHAKNAYEVETGNIVTPSGFVLHPLIKFCGASPDGLIEHDGGIEIKCPKDRRVHMRTWLAGMPAEHYAQVQGNLWVHNRKWWDFVSYDPRAPEGFRLYVQRIERDEIYIPILEAKITRFLGDVEKLVWDFYARENGPLCSADDAPD